MEQNNFSNQKQVDLLQILNFALYKKQYPHDTCGIIEKKIQILNQPTEMPQKGNSDVASIKVRTVVILEILKQIQLGTAHNDLTKICKLVAFLTGNSYNSIYNEAQKGIILFQIS